MLGQAASRLPVAKQFALPTLDLRLLRQLATALLAAAVLETLLLRLVTRVGVHLPRGEAVSDGIQAASFFGALALNFASILAIVLVVLLLGSVALRTRNEIVRLLFAAISGAMLWGLGWSLATGSATADALFGLSAVLLVGWLGLVLVARGGPTREVRLALAIIVFAYFCYQYYTLSHLAFRLLDYGSVPPLSISVLRFGEGLVVVAGGAVFWAWGRGRWRRAGLVGVALVAGIVLAVAFSSLAPASTTSILALWTTGMSFYLPLPVYLLSLAFYLLTIVACWRSGDAFWVAAGLTLLLVAGYMPEATHHHLLLLLGVAFLSGIVRWAVPLSPANTEAAEELVAAG